MSDEENKAQAEEILADATSHPYTITDADVEGCRGILRKLLDLDNLTGGYKVGSVSGYKSSAQVTIHYQKSPGAEITSEAAFVHVDNMDKFGHLLKKVITHHETHKVDADRLAKLKEFLAAHKALDEMSDSISYEHQFSVGEAHRAALDRFQQAEEALG